MSINWDRKTIHEDRERQTQHWERESRCSGQNEAFDGISYSEVCLRTIALTSTTFIRQWNRSTDEYILVEGAADSAFDKSEKSNWLLPEPPEQASETGNLR